MKRNNWIKRYAETTICRDDIEINVCGWVYAGEPEQRYERYGQLPHPGCDPEVDIIESFDPLNGNEITLTPQEESDATEQLIETAYDDDDE